MTRAPLGQNFLVDPLIQEKIVAAFEPSSAFGEIGPGRGALTQHLAKKYSNFSVFEKDEALAREHQKSSTYRTIVGDFLDWDFTDEGRAVENFSLIGNLPYEAGTAIVQRICQYADRVEHFLFMLQKEVVDRICAQPHTRDFAFLTVLVQGQFDVEALDRVGPEAFRPKPLVESQLVRGRRRTERHPQTAAYRKFLMASFRNKRKILKNVLKSALSGEQLENIYREFNFSQTVRAEEIPVDLWPKIYQSLTGTRQL